jgi:hypothetical protein
MEVPFRQRVNTAASQARQTFQIFGAYSFVVRITYGQVKGPATMTAIQISESIRGTRLRRTNMISSGDSNKMEV